MESNDDLLREIEDELAHLDIEDNEAFDLIEGGIRHRWLDRGELARRYRQLHEGEIEYADLLDWLRDREGDARYDP